jgi:[ribosomal protein S5]-alanine N-acetyltransferase
VEQGVVLVTDRLVLREFAPGDTDALIEVLGDPIAMQYYPAPFPRAEVDDWIRRNRVRYRNIGFGLWAMLLKQSGELIGDCGCFVRELEGQVECELGWHVRCDLWGRGYATEAARHCIAYAFSRLGVPRVVALVRPENAASCRVAEKNGMRSERIIFWAGYEHRVYVRQR